MKKASLVALVSLPLLSGCFETDFDFKTVVSPDGSVLRETRIDRRGGAFFKVPEGPGWQGKSWETQGGGVLIPDTFHHTLATGKFAPGQAVPSDYEFDFARQATRWGPEEFKRLEAAGISTPYEEHLFSRNRVRVERKVGWFLRSFTYEETFTNEGVIPLLLEDLRDELRRQHEGVEGAEGFDLEERARHYLEKEILPKIRFHAEVFVPGRIASTNAQRTEGNKAEWTFTMADFANGFSTYQLRVVSRAFRSAVAMLVALVLVSSAGLIFWLLGRFVLFPRFKSTGAEGRSKTARAKRSSGGVRGG